MKQLMVAVAIVSLATTGCGTLGQFRQNCGQACGVRKCLSGLSLQWTGGLLGKKKNDCCCGSCCDSTCGCPGDCCCECTCGCPQDCCCECTCGCPEECCCECTCGCPEECCCACSCGCPDDCCCGDSCSGRCGPCKRLVGRIASGMCCPHSGGYPAMYNFSPGPPVGQTAYPYYTTRGPRDFLQCNPPPLGPY